MFDRLLSNNDCLKWDTQYKINLKTLDKNLSYIIFNILKKIKHLNYNDLIPLFDITSSNGNFPNLNQGNRKTIKCLYPHRCVVKRDNRYFYHKNGIYDNQNLFEYSELIGYKELLRETKLKRIC